MVLCFWLLPLPSPTAAVGWLQWERKFTKQTWRESCRTSTEIKNVVCYNLMRGHGVPNHLQVAEEYSFKSSSFHPCSRWAPEEVDLLELGCLPVAAQPLRACTPSINICPHFLHGTETQVLQLGL